MHFLISCVFLVVAYAKNTKSYAPKKKKKEKKKKRYSLFGDFDWLPFLGINTYIHELVEIISPF